MQNVKTEVNGSTLTITINLKERLGKSGSGKSNMVATTKGNVLIPGAPDGFKLSVNAYVPCD